MLWVACVVGVTGLLYVATRRGKRRRVTVHEFLVPRDVNGTDIRIWPAGNKRHAGGGGAADGVRLGMVCMTRHPLAIESWLEHHRKAVGVVHFFMCVEDSPEVEALLRTKYADCVSITSNRNSDATPAYFSQMDRQATHVNASIKVARERGLTHLVHIDDDELLFCPSGSVAFRACLADECQGYSSISMRNIEAVYDTSDCHDPFATAEWFCIRPTSFTAYTNGKSVGALSDTTLQMQGPHAFTGVSKGMPSHIAVVAHYESACYDRWNDKFRSYAKDTPEACAAGRIPFPFYCESIAAASTASDAGKREVWTRWKTKAAKREGVIHVGVLLHRPAL